MDIESEAWHGSPNVQRLYKYEGSAALLNLLSEAKNSISDKNALEFIKGIVSVLPALPLKCDELALVTEAADSLRGLDNGTSSNSHLLLTHDSNSYSFLEVDSLLSVLTEVVNKPYISDDCSYNNKEFSLQENKKIISSALEHGLSRKLPKIKKILVQNSPSATLRSSLKHSNPDKNSSSGESKRVRFARNEDLVQIRLFEPHPDEISHQVEWGPLLFAILRY